MSTSQAFADFRAAAQHHPPLLALVLGSGMGPVVGRVQSVESIPFAEVPGLAVPTVSGHGGRLILGDWAGTRVLIFEGRLHHYEGHAWERVVQPVHTAATLGARAIFLTNAAGGIHDTLVPESFMALRDHLEWTRPYWWRHPGPGGLGVSRPSPYSERLRTLVRQAAGRLRLPVHEGIYAAVTGPCYETPAEIRALKTWGADAVGMSTAREAQAASDLGLECVALSCITNRAAGLGDRPLHHGDVLSTAAARAERLADLLGEFLTVLRG